MGMPQRKRVSFHLERAKLQEDAKQASSCMCPEGAEYKWPGTQERAQDSRQSCGTSQKPSRASQAQNRISDTRKSQELPLQPLGSRGSSHQRPLLGNGVVCCQREKNSFFLPKVVPSRKSQIRSLSCAVADSDKACVFAKTSCV